MIRNLKITTALFLSAVFLFRVIFVNLGIPTVPVSDHGARFVKSQLPKTMKRRQQAESSIAPASGSSYASLEFFEEEADDDAPTKFTTVYLIQVLYSLFASEITDGLCNAQNQSDVAQIPTDRQQLLQVFRI